MNQSFIEGDGFRLEDIQLINSGSYGEIFKAIEVHSKTKVALKRIPIAADNQRTVTEIQIAKRLNGVPGIPRFFHHFETKDSYWLIFEYIKGCNLLEKLLKKKGKLSENFIRKAITQTSEILREIHAKGIAHKDIKLENLMYNEKSKRIYLIDFGLSFQFKEFDSCNDFAGSIEYSAPEMTFGVSNFSSKASDVWALGIVAFTLTFGVFPFAYDQEEDAKMKETGSHPLPRFPEDRIPSKLKDLLKKMLEIESIKRITVEEILKHPFLIKKR